VGTKVLAFTGHTPGVAPRGASLPGLNDEFTGGIAEAIARPPVDLDTVADTCGFIREALATNGSSLSNPLWNLTTLIATFGGDGADGRAMAHRMASGHPEYSYQSTDELYDRKVREKQERNIGWPSCATIQGAGCTSCASCPMLQFGKSPLHFAREQHGAPVASMTTTPRKILKAFGLTDLPMPPRTAQAPARVAVGPLKRFGADRSRRRRQDLADRCLRTERLLRSEPARHARLLRYDARRAAHALYQSMAMTSSGPARRS
jgi:hypothetical protein